MKPGTVRICQLLPGKWLRLWVFGLLSVIALASAGFAASGVQVSPNAKQTLVNKAVAGEQWAIVRDTDDGSVTGNVFNLDGSTPQFVWCNPTASSGDQLSYRCYGASACTALPCGTSDDWTLISDVSLPATFFAPTASMPGPSPTPGGDCATVQPGQRVQADGSEWVVVEVPVILEGSTRRFALRYPVRPGSDGSISVGVQRLNGIMCRSGSCPPSDSVCGYPANVSLTRVGGEVYVEAAGHSYWRNRPNISLLVSIYVDPNYQPVSISFASYDFVAMLSVTAISRFDYSLLRANYPPSEVDADAVRRELGKLLDYVSVVQIAD